MKIKPTNKDKTTTCNSLGFLKMLVWCYQFFFVANLVFPTPCILMPQAYEQHDTMEKIF
jgi:hypothetical protein